MRQTLAILGPAEMSAIGGFFRVAEGVDRYEPSPVMALAMGNAGYPAGGNWKVQWTYRSQSDADVWAGNTFVRVVCAS